MLLVASLLMPCMGHDSQKHAVVLMPGFVLQSYMWARAGARKCTTGHSHGCEVDTQDIR